MTPFIWCAEYNIGWFDQIVFLPIRTFIGANVNHHALATLDSGDMGAHEASLRLAYRAVWG